MTRIALFLLVGISCTFAYENLTPAQVQSRLAAGDSLLLLDVREVSEYQAGHIAEPLGLPVVTPANLPWSSGMLNDYFEALPTDIDIIVYCRSGGRSAAASSFLEGKGFDRIFNMTSGFSGWTYESRTGGYGDGSGAWISGSAQTITCSSNPTLATFTFDAQSEISDSVYVELYQNTIDSSPFTNLPDSSLLFNIAALDRFGLSQFQHDSLALVRQVQYSFSGISENYMCQAFTPQRGWKTLTTTSHTSEMIVDSNTLYKWISLVPVADTRVESPLASLPQRFAAYPNPFNNQLKLDIPVDASITIYDILGRSVAHLSGNSWNPGPEVGSGVYILQVRWRGRMWQQKISYQK